MLQILRQIARIGIRSEPAPAPADEHVIVARLQADIARVIGRALAIRHVDAGSCNGCELEIHALGNPYYNLEGLGIKFVASPRHADMLLVTGPVSKHMAIALKRTLRRHARSQARRRGRRLRLHGRHLRRELREPRPREQRDPRRRRSARLPAHAGGAAGRHPCRDHRQRPAAPRLPKIPRPGLESVGGTAN